MGQVNQTIYSYVGIHSATQTSHTVTGIICIGNICCLFSSSASLQAPKPPRTNPEIKVWWKEIHGKSHLTLSQPVGHTTSLSFFYSVDWGEDETLCEVSGTEQANTVIKVSYHLGNINHVTSTVLTALYKLCHLGFNNEQLSGITLD